MHLSSFLPLLQMPILGTFWNTDITFFFSHKILSGVWNLLFCQSVFCLGANLSHRTIQLPSPYPCCRLVARIVGQHGVHCLIKWLAHTNLRGQDGHSHSSSLYWKHLSPRQCVWIHNLNRNNTLESYIS